MTYTELGFDTSELFSAQINEFNAIFESGQRIDDKLLYAVYAKFFAEDDELKDQIDALLDCFVTDDKLAPLTDSDAIFDNIEEVFGITINASAQPACSRVRKSQAKLLQFLKYRAL